MPELGGLQRYVYWSERRVLSWLEDQNLRFDDKRQRKIATPGFSGKIPSVEWTKENVGPPARPELAQLVEDSWGSLAVTDLGSPPPIQWAKGRGYVTLGEFVVSEPDRAVMYTEQSGSSGEVVGVCLFGSTENYAEFVTEGGPPEQDGWTSSASVAVLKFLREGVIDRGFPTTEEGMATEALKIAKTQGITYRTGDRAEAWLRGHTYGDVLDAEWFAEIFLDFSFDGYTEDGCNRVLIGAPLWIRTPSLRSVRMYADYERRELAEPSATLRSVTAYEGLIGRATRWLFEKTHRANKLGIESAPPSEGK